MKKIVTFILLLCMALSFSACADKKSTPPEITLQEIYDASKVVNLLKDSDSVYVEHSGNGVVYLSDYFTKDCTYSLYEMEETYSEFLITDHSYFHMSSDKTPVRLVPLTPSGAVDMTHFLAKEGEINIFSTELLNDTITSVKEKNGQIIVTSVVDQDELASIEGLLSYEEELVLDAKTRKPISTKTVLRFENEVFEEKTTFTYDAEAPERMKIFEEYDNKTDNLRTVTVISNPGTKDEKTDIIRAPKGLVVGLTVDTQYSDRTFTTYNDAACTQVFDGEPNVNSDITVYIKWNE